MLRVRVELIPHGDESRLEVLDECYIVNDGTGTATGEHEGGIGNYYVTEIDPRVKDYPEEAAVGRIEGQPRTKTHRTQLAVRALQVIQRGRRTAGL